MQQILLLCCLQRIVSSDGTKHLWKQLTIMEAEKAELKSILRGLLISSPRQMTVRDLQHDFARQEGREFPFQKFGFRNFVDYLRTIKDTVVLNGSQPIYVSPVVKANTAHVNEMVLRQKNSAPKKTPLKALDKSRRRGWVPIVIPPDPPKALPTLLSIRVPSRNKNSDMLPREPYTVPSSSFKELDKAKTMTQHKMKNGPNSMYNEEESKSLNKKIDHFSEEHNIEKINALVNGPHKYSTRIDSSNKQTANWKDISKVGNDEMKDNIEEWYHTEPPHPLQHTVSINSAENELSKTENDSQTCDTAMSIALTNVISEFKEENESEVSYIKNNFSAGQQETCNKQDTSSSPSSVLSSDKDCDNSIDESEQNRLLSEKTVLNMKKLIQQNPQGLWASEFPAIYKESYGVSLDYRLCGYMSMVAAAAAYPEVFILLRRSSADYLLLDADKPLPKHYAQTSNTSSYAVVTECLKTNIESLVASFPSGLPTESFKKMYKIYFSEDLNENDLGFSTVDELLHNLHEEFVIRLRHVGEKTLIYPARNSDDFLMDPPLCSYRTEEDPAEMEYSYPPEVFDSNDTIPRVSYPYSTLHVPVLVSDVVSPTNFHMVLCEYKPKLDRLMDELQSFYTSETDSTFKMPECVIRPGVICVARYKRSDWHRAEITSINGGMGKIKVRFIDYGTHDSVDASELRFLHSDFAKCPIQAIPGKLANLKPVNGLEWDREASTCLLRLVENKIVLSIRDVKCEELSVALVDTTRLDDVHINDELVARGHAKFIHAPPSKVKQPQRNGLDTNLWTENEKPNSVENKLNVDHFNLPHSEIVLNSDIWTPLADDKKMSTPSVTDNLNPSVKNFFNSVTKSSSSGAATPVNFSPNTHCDITPQNSYDNKSAKSDIFLSNANITQVWGTPFVMSSPVSTSTVISNETDTSLKLKEIPDTWNVPTNNIPKLNDSHSREVGYSEPDNSALKMIFNDEIKHPLSPKANESTQFSQLSLPEVAILPKKHTTNQFEIPYSNTGLSRNCLNPSLVQSQACVPNMWNLGNISVNASWPPPVNNSVVYNPSTPMWQQQTLWYQPQQSIPQIPLKSFGGVSAVPPPGFTSIHNPFITYSTSPYPTLNQQLSLLTDPFVYQQRNKSWNASVSSVSSNTSPSSPGLYTYQCSSANEFKSPATNPVNSQVSIEHAAMLKKFRSQQRSPKHNLDCDEQSRDNSLAIHHSKNQSMKPFAYNQDNKQSVPSETLADITVEDSDFWKLGDTRKLLVNQAQLSSCSQINSSKNEEQEAVVSESSQHKIDVEASFETVKSSVSTDTGYKQIISSWDSSFQNTDSNTSVNSMDTALHNPMESLPQIGGRNLSIHKSATKLLTDDFESEISKRIEMLAIDSTKRTSDMIKIPDPHPIKSTPQKEILNQHELTRVEYPSEAEVEEKCNVLFQEDTNAILQKDISTSKSKRKPLRCIRKTVLAGKVLTLINYHKKPYFCTDEFVRSFSKFSGRHVLLKIIDTHGLVLPFLEVNRSDNWEMFEMLDNCELNTMSRKPNGQIHDVLHMVPLSSAVDVLTVLKISDVSIYKAVDNEIQNFDPEDNYWYEN